MEDLKRQRDDGQRELEAWRKSTMSISCPVWEAEVRQQLLSISAVLMAATAADNECRGDMNPTY